MSAGKPFFYKINLRAITAGWLILLTSSCVIVKKYQPDKPFVYKTNINLTGNFSNNDDREILASRLKSQLDDSMRARSVSKVLWSEIKNPPLYDSANAGKSIIFMRALLHSLGYFRDSITYDTTLKIVNKDQYRTTVNFNVKPGKVVTLDSISYNIKQQELQSLTQASLKESYLKKGEPFAKSTISIELDRLVDLYRNNGYLRFSRDELKGYWDTLDVSLLQPTLDPFEQLEILQKLRERRENPKANLEIRLTAGFDTGKLIKYFIGNITVYPDYNPDTTGFNRKEVTVNGVKVIYYRNLFKPKILPQNIYLHYGELYNQQKYFKTINRFNSIGSWRLTNIKQIPRKNQDTVDFDIQLSPARKYSFTTNLEGSRNQSAVSGNLFGIAVNAGLQNRNFARGAIQTNTNIRYGTEIGNDSGTVFIQTKQISFSHNIYFPRPIPNSKWIPDKMRENFRTVLSFSAANTERKDLFNLTTFNGSWGYDFELRRTEQKTIHASVKIPNIEYSYLKERDSLKRLINNNPSLKNIFTDGFIASVIAGINITSARNKNLNIFRANLEESGLLTGLIHGNFLDTNLYRFIKLDAEFARKIQYNKSAIALRLFAGVGYELNSTVNHLKRNNLPFFKQYFSGGPNSMRAWGLRKLGPGSTVKDFSGSNGFFDRYGDVQLEANIEFRFPITSISGVKLNGAAFTDIGNVWFLKKQAGLPEEVFNFSNLAKDLAVGAGVGLRIDFSFFIIRFDYSHKVKDPSPSPAYVALQNKWFGYVKKDFFKGNQFQLGIGYPFIL